MQYEGCEGYGGYDGHDGHVVEQCVSYRVRFSMKATIAMLAMIVNNSLFIFAFFQWDEITF